MKETEYSVINFYDHGRRQCVLITFEDYESAKGFAKKCIFGRPIALPKDYGYVEVIRHERGACHYHGDRLLKIMSDGETLEAECGK